MKSFLIQTDYHDIVSKTGRNVSHNIAKKSRSLKLYMSYPQKCPRKFARTFQPQKYAGTTPILQT